MNVSELSSHIEPVDENIPIKEQLTDIKLNIRFIEKLLPHLLFCMRDIEKIKETQFQLIKRIDTIENTIKTELEELSKKVTELLEKKNLPAPDGLYL